ncbi:MAG: Zn-ribbon domain-containing OB-fold protein [Candidatus Electryonea clarkiae]|nr:Zn-ribbon domain-containing OB-fold protein [Candidatus Electryonea clarkiae]MDP8286398.1 Zn-ribbon domain-containing OB-fold protein [Candidatus Electryonea clarkiae]
MAQTLTARVWREQPQRYRMIANKDKKSGKVYFPPRLVTPDDLNAEFEDVQLSGAGKIASWTVIRVAPAPFTDLSPYALAIIETEEGVNVTAQIADCDVENIKTGMPVKFEFRKIYEDNEASIIYYGYKAVIV